MNYMAVALIAFTMGAVAMRLLHEDTIHAYRHESEEVALVKQAAPADFRDHWTSCEKSCPCEFPYGECRLKYMRACLGLNTPEKR